MSLGLLTCSLAGYALYITDIFVVVCKVDHGHLVLLFIWYLYLSFDKIIMNICWTFVRLCLSCWGSTKHLKNYDMYWFLHCMICFLKTICFSHYQCLSVSTPVESESSNTCSKNTPPPEKLKDLRKNSGLLNCSKVADKIIGELWYGVNTWPLTVWK